MASGCRDWSSSARTGAPGVATGGAVSVLQALPVAWLATSLHGHPQVWSAWLVSLGLAGELGAGITLVSEILPKEVRGYGTTIVATTFNGGVVMAGDRRATMGNIIAQRDIEKVFPADEYSCVGIAGTAGLAVEMVRLFQTELEHYEKIEGSPLSMDGKANRLATLIRSNLGMAMQGLAVVPLFAGYDLDRGHGRLFSYDVTGGRYEEHDHHTVGSGSVFAADPLPGSGSAWTGATSPTRTIAMTRRRTPGVIVMIS